MELSRQRAHLLSLGRGEVIQGIIGGSGWDDRLHLHHSPGGPEANDQVDFAATNDNVASQDPTAVTRQKRSGEALTETAETAAMLRRRQSRLAGSSSSMLTSRNVITLTRFTKRAGRYMSHTQASSNSSSKYTEPSTRRVLSSTPLAR